MGTPPKACPYCGQPLVHEDAISHLRRKEAEIEDRRRRLERELWARATAEAKKAAQTEIERKGEGRSGGRVKEGGAAPRQP